MAEIKISNVDALGKPVGPYSHVARVKAGRLDVQPHDAGFRQCASNRFQAGGIRHEAVWGTYLAFLAFLAPLKPHKTGFVDW